MATKRELEEEHAAQLADILAAAETALVEITELHRKTHGCDRWCADVIEIETSIQSITDLT